MTADISELFSYSETSIHHTLKYHFARCINQFVQSLKSHENNVILYPFHCSAKCRFTASIIQNSWFWPKIFLE